VRFTETALPGVWIVDVAPIEDERGFFARTFDADEFGRRGLCPAFPQCSVSFNRREGTLRGMHYQAPPHGEVKLVRCTAGAIYDVALDLRPGSPARGSWAAVELSAANRRMLYIPEGVAHGFQTLAGDSEVYYQISELYHPESARGVRWDDPRFSIGWPDAPARVISARDLEFPLVSTHGEVCG
jgi:dTDP-4-dehydrorhamnose 3,5-epimerase